ncbi:Gtr1/RagA G protein conserved region-domain-containing protein [Phakopsora pachyrhizi]|uniref:GTP-binding protein n=1 Tax=Phakopsora pachyrhizi TaxID=170000 RepID=A0AAV0AIB0_PHAPC|nr:Gtr1/RagA G protein conserved region-domain-containing protein [Phakopsora pachyrhizi]CAH7667696.1 Gtr1/RagA G protein conserved region-domain-containing protein [Phakopsora pachyrhizi]
MSQVDAARKVLLMGKSGSGKSSMRNIIFANMAAADTRKLGATIDMETTAIKFLGHFALRLVDCGGQDSYMSNFLSMPAVNRRSVFSQVGCLLYVFDVESPEFSSIDMIWFSRVISAILETLSQSESIEDFKLHILIHKMDLVPEANRQAVFESRAKEVRNKLEEYSKGKISSEMTHIFSTSIWDETIYKAWSTIVQTLIPEISSLQTPLERFAKFTAAYEVIVFEISTSLVVARWTDQRTTDQIRVVDERRFERASAVVKAFRSASARIRSNFKSMEMTHSKYTAVLDKLTDTTAILVVAVDPQVVPAAIQLNISLSRASFSKLPGLSARAPAPR